MNESPKERILSRTIYLIGKKGSTRVSVREIAKEAQVNVAAINYYFQTKEQMFAQMEQYFIKNYIEVNNILFDDAVSPENRIKNWINTVMSYLIEYPGVITIMSSKTNSIDPDDPIAKSLGVETQRYTLKLIELVKKLSGIENDEKAILCKMAILTASMVDPIVRGDKRIWFNLDFSDEETRLSYIDELIRGLKA